MKKRIISLIFIAVVFVFAFPLTAYADLGPKASLTIIVKNAPAEIYYLDLLVELTDAWDMRYTPEEPPPIPKDEDEMIQALYSYASQGWYPVVHGKVTSCMGKLTGEVAVGDMRHNFTYSPPDRFRIILVTQSGEVSVTDVITRNKFFSEIVYNTHTGRINENTVNGFAQFPLTLMATLIIEGLLLLLFGFKIRDNWKPFLLVNAGTQGILYITLMGISSAYSSFHALLAQPLIEIAIIVIECAIYIKILKWQSKGRITAYAITANLASWFFGGLLLSILLSLFNRIFV